MQRKNSDSNTKNKKGRPLSPKDYLLLYCNMYKQITSEQRYTISILLQQGMKKNMLFMRKLNKDKDAEALAEVVIHLLKPFKNIIKTITTDNGTEFACHERISLTLEAPVYFADPYSSWQKGGIENENGLIRQYIPKSTKMENVSHQDVNRIMHKINRRPREKLNFDTPIECFYEKLS